MVFQEHSFLFASLDSKQPLTARKVHIRRLYDILQLSIQRHDVQRAKRVWSILSRCKEVNWLALWRTGLHLLGEAHTDEDGMRVTADYLRSMMLRYPDDVRLNFAHGQCIYFFVA
jgi:RNA polymerase I-specific transcription initiation factor RRN11